MDRLQRDRAGPDLIGQRQKTDLDPLRGISFGLPVQGLVLAEIPEQDHCQQIGASRLGPAQPHWCGVERGWQLTIARRIVFEQTCGSMSSIVEATIINVELGTSTIQMYGTTAYRAVAFCTKEHLIWWPN